MNLRGGGVISSLDSCSLGQQHHFWSDFANIEKGHCFEEKAQSLSFRRPSLSKVSFCVSLPTTADLETWPQLCLHLGPRAREPKLQEGGPGAGWGQNGRSLGPTLAEILASKRVKFSRHQFGYEAPVPRGPGSQLPPSRPPKKNGRSGTGHHRRSSPLAPSLTAERVQGMQPRSTHTLLPSSGDLVCLGHNDHPRCPWVLTTTASQG